MTDFLTLKESSEGFFKDRGSRFIAHAIPVSNESEIKAAQEQLRKKYFDARHHCYAYILGLKSQRVRANDDGEPNHSAGDPILGQIRANGLTNVLVVVIRYFGGTKLGVGGLVQAYKSATEDALKAAKKVKIFPQTRFRVNYGYDQTSRVETLLGAFELQIIKREFGETCYLEALIREEHFELLLAQNEPPNPLAIETITSTDQ